jgi:hypothetical protein
MGSTTSAAGATGAGVTGAGAPGTGAGAGAAAGFAPRQPLSIGTTIANANTRLMTMINFGNAFRFT